jgi:hypothetical protein
VSIVVDRWGCGKAVGGLQNVTPTDGSNGIVVSIKAVDVPMMHAKFHDG